MAVISQYIENQDTNVDGDGADEATYGQALISCPILFERYR